MGKKVCVCRVDPPPGRRRRTRKRAQKSTRTPITRSAETTMVTTMRVKAHTAAAGAVRQQVRGLRSLGGRQSVPSSSSAGQGRSAARVVRVEAKVSPFDEYGTDPKNSVVKPINGDPFIGMFETPVTSAPIVANFLSNLPAYRTGVKPLLRGVEIGLTHGFFLPGPFIKLGPLRAIKGTAEIAGCMSAAGLLIILTSCLSIYGAVSFTRKDTIGIKSLSGREIARDELQSSAGWEKFTSGWMVGSLSG